MKKYYLEKEVYSIGGQGWVIVDAGFSYNVLAQKMTRLWATNPTYYYRITMEI
jgi:hypothetical protein